MDKLKTPQEVYDLIWKEDMEDGAGELNRQKVIEALYSYAATISNNSILYEYITDGHVTDPYTPVSVVMQASDELLSGIIVSNMQDLVQDLLDKGSMVVNKADRTVFYEAAFERMLTRPHEH